MATLGQAWVEIHADTRPFAKELNKQIKEHLRKLDATVSTEGVTVGTTLGKSISKGLDKETDRSLSTWRQRFTTWARDTGREGASEFRKAFDRMATGNFILFRVIGSLGQRFGSLLATVGRVGRELFQFTKSLLKANGAMLMLGFEGIKTLLGLGGDLSKSLASAQQAGTQLVGALASLASSAASGAIGLAAMAAGAVLLVGALSALAAILIVAIAPFATLLNFGLALPAALSVLLAIVLPLTIALHNIGDALELVFEQDPDKFAKGLKKLSPVLRELVVSLRTVAPIFRSIQKTVQEAFFGPIMMILIPAIKSIAPALQRGLETAARSMGVFVANAISLLKDPAFTRFINDLFPAVARMVEALSFPLIHFVSALTSATTAALPTVEALLGKLAGFIDQFASWIEGTIADGRFQKFLDDAVASLQSIWGLIQALISLFSELFTQTDDGGRRFLDKITAAINKFTAWLKSPEGKRALQDAVLLALAFAEGFGIALSVIRVIVGVLASAIRKAEFLLELIGIIKGDRGAIRARQPTVSGGMQTGVQYSGGGVVPHDQIAMVHKGEPILDPANTADKNRGILAEAGMLDMLSTGTTVIVNVGNQQFEEYIDYRVQQANRGNAKAMSYGPRGGR
jgi:hypothetical protein